MNDPIALLKQQIQQANQKGDTQEEYYLQGQLGNAFFAMDDLEHAFGAYEAARHAAIMSTNLPGEAMTFTSLGQVRARQGIFPQALFYLEKALSMARALADQKVEGSALALMGAVYHGMHEKEKALQSFEEALRIARESDNQELEKATSQGLDLLRSEANHEELDLSASPVDKETELPVVPVQEESKSPGLSDKEQNSSPNALPLPLVSGAVEGLRKAYRRKPQQWMRRYLVTLMLLAVAVASTWALDGSRVIPRPLSVNIMMILALMVLCIATLHVIVYTPYSYFGETKASKGANS